MKIHPGLHNHLERPDLVNHPAYIKKLFQEWVKGLLRTEFKVTIEDLVENLKQYKKLFGEERSYKSHETHNTFVHFLLSETTDELLTELVENNMECVSDIIRHYCQNGGFENWERPDGNPGVEGSKEIIPGFENGVLRRKKKTSSCPGCHTKQDGNFCTGGNVCKGENVCASCSKYLTGWMPQTAQGDLAALGEMLKRNASKLFSSCKITDDLYGEKTVHHGVPKDACHNWLDKLGDLADALLNRQKQLEAIGLRVDPIWSEKAQVFVDVLEQTKKVNGLAKKKQTLMDFAKEVNTWRV